MRVLVAEADPITAQVISRTLQARGAVVERADTGGDALDLARRYDFDIVVLDLRLPDMEGYDLIRRLRAARVATPLLALSSISSPQPRLKAFELGADEFMTKPFDNRELLARVQAVVRRSKGLSQSCVRIGPLMLDLNDRVVTINDEVVKLGRKESLMLELLALHRDKAVTKEAFLSHLYDGENDPQPKIVDVFICKLRKKLAQAGGNDLIETVWGRGYMLRDPSAALPRLFRPRATAQVQECIVAEAA